MNVLKCKDCEHTEEVKTVIIGKVCVKCDGYMTILISEKAGVSKVPCIDVLCNLLREALAIVDGKGRAIPGGSYAVWKGDWQDLRDTIFKAYEVVNKEVA